MEILAVGNHCDLVHQQFKGWEWFLHSRGPFKKRAPSNLPQDENDFKFSIRRFKATSTTDIGIYITEHRRKIMGPPIIALRKASTSVTYLF